MILKLQATVESLKTRVGELEADNAKLKKRVEALEARKNARTNK